MTCQARQARRQAAVGFAICRDATGSVAGITGLAMNRLQMIVCYMGV
jgi:hypothetical protein